MSDRPKIRILPDQESGRDEELGRVLEFEVDANDNALKALVTWQELASFRNSRTRKREQWLPIDQLQPEPGEVYADVKRTPAAKPATAPESTPPDGTPHGWPEGVPAPGIDGWDKIATSWLFDQMPADFRGHAVLAEHPAALAWMARLNLRHAYTAVVRGYRSAAFELKGQLPPHALAELDMVYRLERERIIGCGRAIDALERAWQ